MEADITLERRSGPVTRVMARLMSAVRLNSPRTLSGRIRALAHPLFDGAEWMLDAVAPLVEHIGSERQPRPCDPSVLQARDAAE